MCLRGIGSRSDGEEPSHEPRQNHCSSRPRCILAAAFVPAQAGAHGGHGHHGDDAHDRSRTACDGPRGVDNLGHGKTLVTEADGTFSLVVERKHGDPKVIELGSVPAGLRSPAICRRPARQGLHPDRWRRPPGTGAATLYQWHWGDDAPTPVFDVAAYQAERPRPRRPSRTFPEDSNPFGVAALRDGSVLVVRRGRQRPAPGLARHRARGHRRPAQAACGRRCRRACPTTDPEGNPLPPAGHRRSDARAWPPR